LSQAEFSENTGRIPKLVGILATDKEDAANYAEVSTGSGLLGWGTGWVLGRLRGAQGWTKGKERDMWEEGGFSGNLVQGG
jgi:hypothetical protein